MARNYLIGRGELLVEPVGPPPMKPTKVHPYSIEESRDRLVPLLERTLEAMVPGDASPDGVHVARMALHPAYIAKTYYPDDLLRELGLEAVGSRHRTVRPANHTVQDWEGAEFGTSEIFVAGTRSAFESFYSRLATGASLDRIGQIREIETIAPFRAGEKLLGVDEGALEGAFEIVLHLPAESMAPHNASQFLRYAEARGFDVRPDLSFIVKGLWFVPGVGPVALARELAEYSTVRAIRPMPALSVSPEPRTVSLSETAVALPPGAVISDTPRVAILDGGLPENHALGDWIASYRELDPSADNHPGYEQHGLAVASAFLFGPIDPSGRASTPPAKVTVFRVLDSNTAQEDPFELYRTLGHVEEVLLTRSFDYVNLSLGPVLPIDDDEVHAWTALVDQLLADGATLLTVAAGNNGEHDWGSGNARVQVPSDAVNALAVGAADRSGAAWERAPYSAVGPGRSPGLVKPDVVIHGGSSREYFHVVSDGAAPVLLPATGTSLAAPFALRQAVSIRALLGSELSPLAIRALLIHGADQDGKNQREVGWGRVSADYETLVSSGPGVARVVYQGELLPGKYIRARVPVPRKGIDGRVKLSATFCFATPVDAKSPDVYTRAGLEVRFRPDLAVVKKGSKSPATRSFFSPAAYSTEGLLRTDDGKWETVLNASTRMLGRTLREPVFDVHYNARDEGGKSRALDPLSYALVITIEAPKHVDLFNEVLNDYPALIAIEPEVEIGVEA